MLLATLGLLAAPAAAPVPALPVTLEPGLPAVAAFGSLPDAELRALRVQLRAGAAALLAPGACAVEDAHFRSEQGGCKDLVSGLVWSQHFPNAMQRQEAIDHCAALVEDGYDDWFLPTKDELLDLAVHEGTDSGDAWHLNWTPLPAHYHWTTSKRGSKSWLVNVTDDVAGLFLEGSAGWTVCARVGTSDPGGGATAVHVEAIALSTQNAGQGKKRGRAQVTVLDDLGAPAQNAQVTGSFSGAFTETVVASTDSNGVAVLTTSATASGGISFGFCVDDVTLSGLAYDPGANVETCDAF